MTGRVAGAFIGAEGAPRSLTRSRLNREQIIDAAAEIADADGLAAINTARLAGRLRIKAPSLYRHFANVEVIKEALAVRALGEMIDLHKDATPGRTGREALFALAHALRTYAQARPGRYLSANHGGHSQTPSVARLRQTYLRLIANVIETYHIDADASTEVARCVVAALQGFVMLELNAAAGDPFEADQSFQRLLDMLDAGVRSAARSHANRKAANKGVRRSQRPAQDQPMQPHGARS